MKLPLEKIKTILGKVKAVLDKERCLPLILTAVIIAADQLTKSYIVMNWPREGTLISDLFENDVVLFVHVRNKAIAFSLGQGLPDNVRPVLFIILPVIVLGFLLWYYFTSSDFRLPQRIAVAGIIGGGTGNIIDRIMRPDGVVDFISVKFYGILGMERWPTFNIADASVVICCIVLFVSIIFSPKEDEKINLPIPEGKTSE